MGIDNLLAAIYGSRKYEECAWCGIKRASSPFTYSRVYVCDICIHAAFSNLSDRVVNALMGQGIYSLSEASVLTDKQLLDLHDIGKTSLREIRIAQLAKEKRLLQKRREQMLCAENPDSSEIDRAIDVMEQVYRFGSTE